MKTTITFLLLGLLALSSCIKQPTTSFTTDSSTYEMNETVTFTNLSTNSETYLWEFGDGETSTEMNPTHLYETYGDMTVKLTCYSKKEKKTSNYSKLITIFHPTELKLVVKDYLDTPQENLSISIYISSFDYNSQTNAIATVSTDSNGEVIFPYIEPIGYYFGTETGYLTPSATENDISLHATTSFDVVYVSGK